MIKNKLKIGASVFAISILTLGTVMYGHSSAVVPGVNELVSVSSSGTQANQASHRADISSDGRYTAFESSASNLVSGDTNGARDVFLRDRTTGTTIRISVSSSTTEGNSDSTSPAISYSGKYVVFSSSASNLVSGDTNGTQDVFLYDIQNATTVLVSKTSVGTIGNNHSTNPDVSSDGRFVTFISYASNLVSGINPSGVGQQVFLKDMATGAVKALSVSSSGIMANYGNVEPHISCDGGTALFTTLASNLVNGDTNNKTDIFLVELGWSGDVISNITIGADEDSAHPDLSCDGNRVVYNSAATNLVGGDTNNQSDIFQYDRAAKSTIRISLTGADGQTSAPSEYPTQSGDGRFIVFESTANNMDSYTGQASAPNVYVRDVKNGTTQTVSRNATYRVGNSRQAVVSGDGSYITFLSAEQSSSPFGKLVSSDTNGYQDVFVSESGL
jgi:hypothetical protein